MPKIRTYKVDLPTIQRLEVACSDIACIIPGVSACFGRALVPLYICKARTEAASNTLMQSRRKASDSVERQDRSDLCE